jgi:hypothetical protein
VRDLTGPPWEVAALKGPRPAGGLRDLGERGGLEVPGLRLLDRDLHPPVRLPQARGLRALLRQRLGDRRLHRPPPRHPLLGWKLSTGGSGLLQRPAGGGAQ